MLPDRVVKVLKHLEVFGAILIDLPVCRLRDVFKNIKDRVLPY